MFSNKCKYVPKILIIYVKIMNNNSVYYIWYLKLLFIICSVVVINCIIIIYKRYKFK